MRTCVGRTKAVACACALALPLALGLGATADAATTVAVSLTAPPTVTVTMDAAATTLTLSRDPSGARRIHEDGRALTLSSGVPNTGGCDLDAAVAGDIVCTDVGPFIWNVGNNPSATPTARDVVIAKSAT